MTLIVKDTEIKEIRFLGLKTEKLLSALYLVTNYLSDKDPIKWRLRGLAFQIYSIVYDLYYREREGVHFNLNGQIKSFSLIRKLDKIIDLAGVVIASGSASQMNFSLIQAEYKELRQTIKNIFSESDWRRQLRPTEDEVADKNQNNEGQKVYKNEDLSNRVLADNVYETKNNKAHLKDKKKIKLANKRNRISKITTSLKGQEWSSIKDIVKAVPGYSSKTIQREINDLVASNVLKKKGERRWSRYALADA